MSAFLNSDQAKAEEQDVKKLEAQVVELERKVVVLERLLAQYAGEAALWKSKALMNLTPALTPGPSPDYRRGGEEASATATLPIPGEGGEV